MSGCASPSVPMYVKTQRGRKWHHVKGAMWEYGLLAETYGCGILRCAYRRVSRPPQADLCRHCLEAEKRERAGQELPNRRPPAANYSRVPRPRASGQGA